MRVHPFTALRPVPDQVAAIASVPYDVVDRDEATALAADNPLSFLRVVRAEIELPDADAYAPEVYQRGLDNLMRLVEEGAMVREATPSLYAYRLQTNDHSQTGLCGCVHIDDYAADLIKKHEKTRPDKEDDRTRHILALAADAEPVILTYRPDAEVDGLLDAATAGEPLLDFTADDGVRHTVWRCEATDDLVTAFARVPCVYVADGHHRCASAWRAGEQLRAAAGEITGDEEFHWFPAVLFPSDRLRILAYNRVVRTDLSPTAVLERLAETGKVTPTDAPGPERAGVFGVRVGGRWYRLAFDPDSIDHSDPIRSLDCDLLQRRVLGPIFAIDDPRTHPDISFVGGSRGITELERRAGERGVAFAMFPTDIDQLLRVADAGDVMPPKSTWFEPKLRSGLFVHLLDD